MNALVMLEKAAATSPDAPTLVSTRPPGRAPSEGGDLPGPGATLAGKYELIRVLGRGGMGVVMEARDLRLGRRVAIKMIAPGVWQSPELVARFEREARAAARLQSQHAVRLLDVDVVKPSLPFMVMEFLEGEGLDAELRERGPLPVGEAVSYVLEACEAMIEAHAAGIIHRDLKPSNLFLSRSGGRRTLKVLDFGISKITDELERGITQTRSTFGTPEYMSPEQVRAVHSVDARSDVWSLGVVLYQLLAGSTPFAGDTAPAIFAAIVTDAPQPLRLLRPDVPLELELAIARALCKNPRDRYPSALAFAEALAPFAPPAPRSPSAAAFDASAAPQVLSPLRSAPDGMATTRPVRAGSRWALLAALGVASALVGIGVTWFGLNAQPHGSGTVVRVVQPSSPADPAPPGPSPALGAAALPPAGLPGGQGGLSAGQTGLPSGQEGLPAASAGLAAAQTGLPAAPTGFPAAQTGVPAAQAGLPAAQAGLPAAPTGLPAAQTGLPAAPAARSGTSAGHAARPSPAAPAEPAPREGPRAERGQAAARAAAPAQGKGDEAGAASVRRAPPAAAPAEAAPLPLAPDGNPARF